jgi:hypothetical protein
MFSKGTFLRYLFEISSTQKRMTELYTSLMSQTADPAVRDVIAESLEQVKGETSIVGDIRAAVQDDT